MSARRNGKRGRSRSKSFERAEGEQQGGRVRHYPTHLLSGLMTCKQCGAAIAQVGGYYGCVTPAGPLLEAEGFRPLSTLSRWLFRSAPRVTVRESVTGTGFEVVLEAAGLCSSPAQDPQTVEVSSDQCLLLLTTPAVELSLATDGGSLRVKRLNKDKRDGTPFVRVACASAGVMSVGTLLGVSRVAYVEGAIGAAENVDVVHGIPPEESRGTKNEDWQYAGTALRLASLAQGTIRLASASPREGPAMSERSNTL